MEEIRMYEKNEYINMNTYEMQLYKFLFVPLKDFIYKCFMIKQICDKFFKKLIKFTENKYFNNYNNYFSNKLQIKLFDFQIDILNFIEEEESRQKIALVFCSTGTGKTYTAKKSIELALNNNNNKNIVYLNSSFACSQLEKELNINNLKDPSDFGFWDMQINRLRGIASLEESK